MSVDSSLDSPNLQFPIWSWSC